MPRRIVFDIRTLADSKGHSDGIVRTLRALAHYAADERADVVFAIFDSDVEAFRPLRPEWVSAVLGGAKVDTTHFPDPFGKRPRLRERLPLRWKRVALAIQRPRRRAFLAVTSRRLARHKRSRVLDRLHGWLMSPKYRAELADAKGGLRLLLPFETAMDKPLTLTKQDVIFLAGSDWSAMHRIAIYVSHAPGPKLVVLCHDIIPIMFPQFFRPIDANRFRACYHQLFPAAALTILTSKRVDADVRSYCEAQGLPLRRTAIVALGADFTRIDPPSLSPLPDGVESGRYALFVSTIEPRKNHRLLLSVWRRLIADGIPQANRFKMIFVGKVGWLMDDFVQELRSDPVLGESLLLLSNVEDAALASLYANAAFCVYPSFYEGFGLPVIEAFRYGKPVIVSTGGALPEVAQNFSPNLDPHDEDVWAEQLAAWIERPDERAELEFAIRSKFEVRGWSVAAKHMFDTIDTVTAETCGRIGADAHS